MTWLSVGEKEPWFGTFADSCGVNTLTVANFKLLAWPLWTQSWDTGSQFTLANQDRQLPPTPEWMSCICPNTASQSLAHPLLARELWWWHDRGRQGVEWEGGWVEGACSAQPTGPRLTLLLSLQFPPKMPLSGPLSRWDVVPSMSLQDCKPCSPHPPLDQLQRSSWSSNTLLRFLAK